jgi:hypothetical protein
MPPSPPALQFSFTAKGPPMALHWATDTAAVISGSPLQAGEEKPARDTVDCAEAAPITDRESTASRPLHEEAMAG